MLRRLLGLETEYAIRYSPSTPGAPRPSNEQVFSAIADGVRCRVAAQPGDRGEPGRGQIFTQNGGSLYYEVLPHALSGGLLEAATPECRGPSEALLYQRAQESMLLNAIPFAREVLGGSGWDGDIGLIKNCRDAEGHVYGAQENYEVEIARGPMLWIYRLGLALMLPLLPIELLVFWTVVLVVILSVLAVVAISALTGALFPSTRRFLAPFEALWDDQTVLGKRAGFVAMWIESLLYIPIIVPMTLLLRLTAFRAIRRGASAFILSRAVITGAGTLFPDGTFALSEKGPAMRRMMRSFVDPNNRPVFDTGNLFKGFSAFLYLKLRPVFALFARRQRMQLGFSDANAAQVAEYLKVGTTSLVIDMAEAGLLRDAPRPKKPIPALHALVGDPTLKVAVEMKDGSMMTALQIQRWYLERARKYLAESEVTSLEARDVVRLWGEALDGLEKNPASMVGRIDWVTKRYLIEGSGAESDAEKKKIDLKYHELGHGYFAEMERNGVAPVLVKANEIERAIYEPPQETPARTRGAMVRQLAGSPARATVSWGSIRIGGRIGGRVIRLDDFRSKS